MSAFRTFRAQWKNVPAFARVEQNEFMSYDWQIRNSVTNQTKVQAFLAQAGVSESFMQEVKAGFSHSPMAVRLTPYMLSLMDWSQPRLCPIRRQFLPLVSEFSLDHRLGTLDSLGETSDTPGTIRCVRRLFSRLMFPLLSGRISTMFNMNRLYPDRALFLPISLCPVYCRFCTRSYGVGVNTSTVQKTPFRPGKRRWEGVFNYIERTPELRDIVVSGGDAYMLSADQLALIGERLLAIPHIRRIRIATKGLAVAPMRLLQPGDPWCAALVELVKNGRKAGKHVALHTHFNHANEISEVTEAAARLLFEECVTVRNQTVMLRGVNDNEQSMLDLVRKLADINILPYYVYQCDMVRGCEDFRTPLSTMINVEQAVRGQITGFCMPQFIVDLPGGGGKRLVSSHSAYDPVTGVSEWKSPGVKPEAAFYYADPLHSLKEEVVDQWKTIPYPDHTTLAQLARGIGPIRTQ